MAKKVETAKTPSFDTFLNQITTTQNITSSTRQVKFSFGNIVVIDFVIQRDGLDINIKNLERLVFDQCQLNEDKCKILADSLMRTKKLRIF